MNKDDWATYDELYKKYEDARAAYENAQMSLRGAFSELARNFDQGSLDQNRLYEEEKAHERFKEAREALHLFIQSHMKKD